MPVATAAAKRYAKAIFELAQPADEMEAWSRRLASVAELFDDPHVAAVLRNPTIPADRRDALVASAPHVLDPEGTNLARLLIESDRIEEARAIEEEFERLADEAAGRVRATVTTATVATRLQQLRRRLAAT
ncbi:MAG: ATP synthase F1 subunit delta [Chloroflexi bacterium]|nr:MAG: ATP synthase F1 subunit delta [Chloroflexota bacterium]